jgi:hypothetical protein
MFSTGRRPAYTARTEVVVAGDGLQLRRSAVHASGVEEHHPGVRRVAPEAEPERHGAELVQLLVDHPERRGDLLRSWTALVPAAEWAPVDLVPHNILVGSDGTLVAIDQEWEVQGYDRDCLVVRGLLLAAMGIAAASRREVHDPPTTIRDLVVELAADADVELSAALVDRFIAQEATFQAAVGSGAGSMEERTSTAQRDLRTILAQDVTEVRGGRRFDLQWQRAVDDLSQAGRLAEARDARIAELSEQLEAVHARLGATVDERLRRRLGPLRRRLGRSAGAR